jgi:DNA-binding MarR family transcriptional regulator
MVHMKNETTTTPEDEASARMLLETVPPLMRMLHGTLRRGCADDELPTFGQMRMLAMLRERSWKLTDLATSHHVTPSTMSRLVDLLERRGWVQRAHAADDRRKVLLTLTEEGRKVDSLLTAQSIRAIAELMHKLEPDERSQMIIGLAVLRRLAMRAAEPTDEETRAS